MGKEKIKVNAIEDFLNELFPHARCELNYQKDYELAIAVILSAQCKDDKVNKVTPILFNKYPSLVELAGASFDDVEKILRPLGLSNNKARNIINFAQELINKYSSILPSDITELTSLSGVGEKTAKVIRIELFKIPDFPVDTHIKRIASRLNLSIKTEPSKISNDLKSLFKIDDWIRLHHQLIFFGRYMCKAKHPECKTCKLQDFCAFFKQK